jgi:hypothetical protein
MALFGRPNPEDDRRAQEWGEWLRRRNPFAIGSLVLGVFSLIEFGVLIVFGVAGIALGAVALRQLREPAEGGPTHGHGMAWAGIVTSVVSLVIAAWLYTAGPRGPR